MDDDFAIRVDHSPYFGYIKRVPSRIPMVRALMAIVVTMQVLMQSQRGP